MPITSILPTSRSGEAGCEQRTTTGKEARSAAQTGPDVTPEPRSHRDAVCSCSQASNSANSRDIVTSD
jgi:hypothetical protein